MEIIKIKEQSINAEESKFYKKILDSLGIVYEIEEIKKEQVDVPIYVLFEELDVRANNTLRSVTNDVTITLSTFIKQYSKRDILRVRNAGKHTLSLIEEAFKKFGYELN
jgi:DNA-directed RNA polymerase alpha subunit|uniref:DNA-directed RNA polymerase subunit alpha n=1 Tax=Podoviridae sp. ct8Lf7 TaxID=2827723 RepID=A0A8S5S1C3_9CAUD|nr:MAG TPA: DNA-directed RNA polymerase subunit alpha [Podoviridae sp. ct8Lf7]